MQVWGTTMTQVFELLKRISARKEDAAPQHAQGTP